jgi:hypothetical protein
MTTSDHKTTMFLGETMAIDQYDDDIALTAYVWRHYLHLLTPLEKRVGVYSVPIVSDSPMEKARRLHQMGCIANGHSTIPNACDEKIVGRNSGRIDHQSLCFLQTVDSDTNCETMYLVRSIMA